MKYSTILAASLATAVTGRSILRSEQAVLQKTGVEATPEVEKSLIEFGPGDTQWVTDDEKWALKRASRNPTVA